MATKVKYTQPLFGEANAAGYLILVPGASVLIRQNGVATTVYSSNAGAAMTNPVPTGVSPGTAGVDVNGTLTVYLEPGTGYDGLATVGATSSTFTIGDISPTSADVQAPIPPNTYVGIGDAAGGVLDGTFPNPDFAGFYWAESHGVVCDGVTDNTAALNDLFATIQAAGGGTIVFPQNKVCRCDGRLILANDGAPFAPTLPVQAPVRMTSFGGSNQRGQTRTGPDEVGFRLDLRYAGRTDANCGVTAGSAVVTDASITADDLGAFVVQTVTNGIPDRAQIIAVTPGVSFEMTFPAYASGTVSLTIGHARITTLGIGYLEIDHIGLVSNGPTSLPFGISTGTTVNIHENKFYGYHTKNGILCDEDIWWFGGQTPDTNNNPADCFQGYGSGIWKNHFDRVRRIMVGVYVATLDITHNNWWQRCGSNRSQPTTLTGASITVAGGPITSLSVAALTAPFLAGDVVQIGRGQTQTTATLSADAAIGATTLAVNSFTPNATYAAGTVITNTTRWAGGMIEVFNGGDGGALQATNMFVQKNRFQFAANNHYSWGVFGGRGCTTCQLGPNDAEDSNSMALAVYRLDIESEYNLIFSGQVANPNMNLVDDVGGTSTVISSRQSRPSVLPQGFKSVGSTSEWTDQNAPRIKDAAGNYWQERSQATDGRQLAFRYTPVVGAEDVPFLLNRSSAATLIATLGGTSTSQLVATNELRLQAVAGSRVRIGDPTNTGRTNVLNGMLETTHTVGIGTTPAVAAAGASTGVTITGKDVGMTVSLTTAAGLAADAAVAAVTYAIAWNAAAPSSTPRLALTPKGAAAVAARPYITGDSATGFSIALNNPPAGATAMVFDVVVVGA